MLIKVERYERIAESPAASMVAEAITVGLRDGILTENAQLALHPMAMAFCAINEDGETVGVIVYFRDRVTGQYTVPLGYVEPSSRRAGVYRQLWAALVSRAKNQRVKEIKTSVHIDNDAMAETADALGLKCLGYTYAFSV